MARFSFVLTSLNYVELVHLLVDFPLEIFKIDDHLVPILVKCGSIFRLHKSMNLQLLIDNNLNLLHRLKDQEPRLDIQHMTQTMCYVEECLTNDHISLIDISHSFTWFCIGRGYRGLSTRYRI